MLQSQSDYALVVDPHREMTEMIFGHCISQIVRTAAELSLADHLAAGPLCAQEIAERERTAPGTTFRLMRACAALGLLTTDEAGRFGGTPLLDTLRTEAPRSLRAFAMGVTNRAAWLPWTQFGASVRTGHSQAHNALGMDFFDYLEQHPELAQEFSAGMSSGTSVWAPELAALIDTTNVRRAVDVGGANGALLALLQKANPALQGIVFDRPNIAKDAEQHIARNGFAERTEVVGGDFFDSVPPGDLYLLKFILHDWDDESCVKILRRCREAMEPGGRIAIFEFVVGDDGEDSLSALMDLNMLAVTVNGRERSLEEFDALLHRAGLRRAAVLTADSPQSVIEAVAA
jgi:predicted O-methyltransferase YrrM